MIVSPGNLAEQWQDELYRKFNQYVGIMEHSGYLVKVAVAQKQIADDEAKRQAEAAACAAAARGDDHTRQHRRRRVNHNPPDVPVGRLGDSAIRSSRRAAAPKNRRFYMSADLDTTRINRDVQKYVEEIIKHLTSAGGVRVKVSLEVEAETDDGFTQQTVRTISGNCRTLRVRDSGFEE